MATITARIPESLLKRAQATTEQRDAASAVRRAWEIYSAPYFSIPESPQIRAQHNRSQLTIPGHLSVSPMI